ncbi:MAG: cell division protein ZapA [Thermodesulfobacteriota bacterium]|nr:cell division protein ZapA [Thermodesulfobacteriota bacterium]
MDRVISIELFGQTYRFRTDASLVHAEKIVDYVAQQVQKAGAGGDIPGKLDTVILAALNIANDYFEMKRCRDELALDIDKRCSVLIDTIDTNA